MVGPKLRAKSWGIACMLALCVALVAALVPRMSFADEPTKMTEGDVIPEFVPAGTNCESSDPGVAWVDKAGNLNALRAGTTTISDGKQTFEMIRADDEIKDIPVVFLTGVNDKAHITEVLKLIPAGYMLKPYEPEKLLSTIKNVLESNN